MSIVQTEITLKNSADVINAMEGRISGSEIRELTVTAVVDTGAWTLVINEEVRQKLGLIPKGRSSSTLANGTKEVYMLTSPVEIHWKNRETTCPALLAPNAKKVLLGAIPLEGMDLTVNPKSKEVIGAHGEEAQYALY